VVHGNVPGAGRLRWPGNSIRHKLVELSPNGMPSEQVVEMSREMAGASIEHLVFNMPSTLRESSNGKASSAGTQGRNARETPLSLELVIQAAARADPRSESSHLPAPGHARLPRRI
jgi:hypothetical protein